MLREVITSFLENILEYKGVYFMIIPMYIVMFILVFIVLIVTIAVYFQVYKRHINKALETSTGTHSSMAPPYKVAIVMTAISLVICILISYFMGYAKAYRDYEKEIWALSTSDIQTFYAEVKEVGEHSLLVEGISLNDTKYQGEFRYEVWGEVPIVRQDTPISLSDLVDGDLVSVTLLTDRTGITQIFKIQLLSNVV